MELIHHILEEYGFLKEGEKQSNILKNSYFFILFTKIKVIVLEHKSVFFYPEIKIFVKKLMKYVGQSLVNLSNHTNMPHFH